MGSHYECPNFSLFLLGLHAIGFLPSSFLLSLSLWVGWLVVCATVAAHFSLSASWLFGFKGFYVFSICPLPFPYPLASSSRGAWSLLSL